MAFRYPPPPFNRPLDQCVVAPPVPVTDFSIPPPRLPQLVATNVWPSDTYTSHPLPHQQYLVQTPTDWFPANPPTEGILVGETSSSNEVQSNDVWLKNWLPKVRKPDDTHLRETTRNLKVFEAKCMLQSCLMKLRKLDSLQKELKVNHNDTSWKQNWDCVTELKGQINDSLDKIDEHGVLQSLKKTLEKRAKKRQRQKVQSGLCKEKMKQSTIRRQQLHRNIDSWLKNMQEVVEHAKREESLKHEADQVLSEVTRKKSEARRQSNMLSALLKLRHIRTQTVKSRGQHVDAESSLRFMRVVEHLQKLWEDQLKGYDVEEQGLRVMLDEVVVERTKSEVIQDRKVLTEWETLLFGKRGDADHFYTAAEHDVGAFVAVRKSWDKFVAPPGAAMSSSIPIGWVLPSNPTAESWESLLNNSDVN